MVSIRLGLDWMLSPAEGTTLAGIIAIIISIQIKAKMFTLLSAWDSGGRTWDGFCAANIRIRTSGGFEILQTIRNFAGSTIFMSFPDSCWRWDAFYWLDGKDWFRDSS